MTTVYVASRDAILVHAKAAAAAVDSKWTDVAIGVGIPAGRCGRVYYGGETSPHQMAERRVLNGELVAERVHLAWFWPLASVGTSEYKVIDDEMYAIKHEVRTRLQGDSQLGGACTDLDLEYAEPDVVVIGGNRWLTLDAQIVVDFTEYSRAP